MFAAAQEKDGQDRSQQQPPQHDRKVRKIATGIVEDGQNGYWTVISGLEVVSGGRAA
jgi:hypothetical protein